MRLKYNIALLVEHYISVVVNMAFFHNFLYYTKVISLLSIVVVDIIAEPQGVTGERVQQQIEEDSTS